MVVGVRWVEKDTIWVDTRSVLCLSQSKKNPCTSDRDTDDSLTAGVKEVSG